MFQALILFGANYTMKNDEQKTPGLVALESKESSKEEILVALHEVGAMVVEPESQIPQKAQEKDFLHPSNINTASRDVNHNNSHGLTVSRSESCRSVKSSVSAHEAPLRAKSMDEIDDLKEAKSSRLNLRKNLRILSLDGGGIRGLVLTQLLIAIEQEAGRPIHTLFDYLVGTSTGGMAALGLMQKYKATDIQRFYLKELIIYQLNFIPFHIALVIVYISPPLFDFTLTLKFIDQTVKRRMFPRKATLSRSPARSCPSRALRTSKNA